MPEANRHYQDVKQLIRKEKRADPFGGRYRFSPYMACGHACRYCDGRYEKYQVAGDFERDIVIRRNAPELLERELGKLREPGPICISSGVSDPYQPIEREERIMASCAEILARHGRPVTVHTKSALILRDIDHWERLNQRAAFNLWVSLTLTDDALRAIFEPYASPVAERLELLRAFKERGMHVGVLAMPFIPFLADDEEAIEVLIGKLADIGVEFAMPASLTVKTGRQRDTFFGTLAEHFPERISDFTRLYAAEDPYGSPDPEYLRAFNTRIGRVAAAHGMPLRIPHSTYRGQFAVYEEIAILLSDMRHLYEERGRDTLRLRHALKRYREWVAERQRYFNRRRNLSFKQLEKEYVALVAAGGLREILGNQKLADFVRAVIVDGKTFDYLTLALAAGN